MAFSLLLFAISYMQLPRLVQSVAIQDLLDPNMKSTHELEKMQEDYGKTEVLIASLRKPNWTSKDFCNLEFKVGDALFKNPDVKEFQTPLQLRKAELKDSTLLYPRLIPNTCENETKDPLKKLKGSPWDFVLTNPEGTEYSVFIDLKPVEKPGAFGRFDPDRIKNLMKDLSQIDSNFSWSGNLAHEYFNFEGASKNFIVNTLATVVLFIGIRAFFGTWLSAVLFFLTLIFSNTLIFAGMAAAGHPVGPLEACLFLLIMIATLEDFVFVASALIHHPESDYRKEMRILCYPSLITSLTTAIGFGSLMVSDLAMIRRFGLWSCLGAMLEWAVLFLLLPAFLSFFKLKTWVNPEKRWIIKLSQLGTKNLLPRKFILLSLMIFVTVPFFGKFDLSQTPTEMFPADHPYQKNLQLQQSEKGWLAISFLVVNENYPAENKDKLLQELAADPLVYRVSGLNTLIDFFAEDIENSLYKAAVKEQIEQTKLADKYRIKGVSERWVVYLKSTETHSLSLLREKIVNHCPNSECSLVGEYIGFADFSQTLIKTLFESLFVSLVLVGLVMVYLAKKFKVKQWFPLVASILWGPLFVLLIIQVTGTSINMVTCIVASILVGLAGDNAIQYIFAGGGLKESGINEKSDASIICGVLMATLALMFIFSYFQPPRSLGILLAVGFIGNLMGDLWVLKGLLKPATEYKS